jgi:endoglucanase
MRIPRTLKDLLSLPTAAFVETAVLDYIVSACRRLPSVSVRRDRYGNLLAHYRQHARPARPLVFVAHTDHPGFVALDMPDAHTVRAAFRGGVRPEYFTDATVRFWTNGGWVRGRVVEITSAAPPLASPPTVHRPEEVLVRVRAPVTPNAPGMWDLPDPALRGDLLSARGCDDVAGAAAMLELLTRLSRRSPRAGTGEVYCLFTRAEEVGFIGALAAIKARTVPKRLPVISIETSPALSNAPIGGGPILRVGDRVSVFTPALVAFCERVARDLTQRRKSFVFQRRLMDGGTCEATPFLAHGYEAAGICVALGNYHNMDTAGGRIASEYISLADWQRMVDWFEALVLDERGYDGADDWSAAFRDSLARRFAQWEPLL